MVLEDPWERGLRVDGRGWRAGRVAVVHRKGRDGRDERPPAGKQHHPEQRLRRPAVNRAGSACTAKTGESRRFLGGKRQGRAMLPQSRSEVAAANRWKVYLSAVGETKRGRRRGGGKCW